MTVIKRRGGRPKKWEQHKGYSYVSKKSGKTVYVKPHQERYTKGGSRKECKDV